MKHSTSKRTHRLGDLLQREIARILLEEVQDPRLDLVSISGVRLNRDVSVAEILYTHGEGEIRRAEVHDALEKAKGFIRLRLGKELNMRRTPELRFIWDDFLETMIYAHPAQDADPTAS